MEVKLERTDLSRSQLAMMTLIIDASLEALQKGWTHYSVWCDVEIPTERHGQLVRVHIQLTHDHKPSS
jgi:hypothetical protein